MQVDYIEEILKDELSEERFLHTLGVRETAIELAERFNLDTKKAEIAGLLHDCAKCLSKEELRSYFTKDAEELKNYKTLHAPVGAIFAREKFHVRDNEILSAIRWHTLGRVDMNNFEKIIFLADKIEKNTRDLKYRAEILKILDENNGEYGLDLALLRCFGETVKSLIARQLYICRITVDVYNWLLTKV